MTTDQLHPISEDGELFDRFRGEPNPVPAELRMHPTREWDFLPDTGQIEVIDTALKAHALSLPGAPGYYATLVAYEDGTLGIGVIVMDDEAEPDGARTYAVLLQPAESKQAREFLRSDP